jgi:pimeloyl-ACP methyl ester carboxylesterase
VSDALEADELEQLKAIGPPPWGSLRSFGLMTRIARSYEERRVEPDQPLDELWANDYSEDDKENWFEGNEFSQVHFFGLNLDGELPNVDLAATLKKLDVPVFVFQGAEDIRTPANLVQQFLDGLDAPRKELVVLEGGGHDLEFQINNALFAQLQSRVRPLAMH